MSKTAEEIKTDIEACAEMFVFNLSQEIEDSQNPDLHSEDYYAHEVDERWVTDSETALNVCSGKDFADAVNAEGNVMIRGRDFENSFIDYAVGVCHCYYQTCLSNLSRKLQDLFEAGELVASEIEKIEI